MINGTQKQNWVRQPLQAQPIPSGGDYYQQKYKKALKSIEGVIVANKLIKLELDQMRSEKHISESALPLSVKEQLEEEIGKLTMENTHLKQQLEVATASRDELIHNNQYLQAQSKQLAKKVEELQEQVDQITAAHALHEQSVNRQRQGHEYKLMAEKRHLETTVRQLESKLQNSERTWRRKIEEKEVEMIGEKASSRKQWTEELTAVRQESIALKKQNRELESKLMQERGKSDIPTSVAESELPVKLETMRSQIQPLQRELAALRESDHKMQQQTLAEKIALQSRVCELEQLVVTLGEKNREVEKELNKAAEWKIQAEYKETELRGMREERESLLGRLIAMEAREVVVTNRTSSEIESRVAEFEQRMSLLMNGREEGIAVARDARIQEFIAMKAYLMEMNEMIEEMRGSNGELLKKYEKYKQKYQHLQKKESELLRTIDNQKVKIGAYDQLVLRLQRQLHDTMASQRNGFADTVVTRATTQYEDMPVRKSKEDQMFFTWQ